MIAAMACFAIMNVVIRALSASMPSGQMVLLRNVLSFALIAAIVLYFPKLRHGVRHTHRLRGHFWRAGLGFVAMETWFYSLSIMPVTIATALSFTTPIFVTVFAICFFGERAGWRRWTAIFIGFSGVLIILRPGAEIIHSSAMFVLGASALMALSSIVVKSLTRTDPPEVIVFFMAMIMTPLSVPLGVMEWHPVSGYSWFLLVLVAVFSTGAHLLLTRSYLHADMVTLMPFDFTRLIFVAIMGYFWFGEEMDMLSWAGAAVITASSVYIAWREAQIKKVHPEEIRVP